MKVSCATASCPDETAAELVVQKQKRWVTMLPNYLGFNFTKGRRLFLRAVIDAIKRRSDYIRSIKRTGRGDMPIDGIAFDLYPDHGYIALSLRENDAVNRHQNSADWPHFEFISSQQHDFPALRAALTYIEGTYGSHAASGTDHSTELRHLILLAAADALTDPSVAELLKSFDIDAAVWDDRMFPNPGYFDYVVLDANGDIRLNYCELVRANRITRRLIGT
jgi:hypothetical protein